MTVLGADGELIELQRPAVASEPLVRSVAISADGTRCAVIASSRSTDSLDATVTAYNLEAGSGVPVVRRGIAHEADAAPLVRLSQDGRLLLYADSDREATEGPVLVGLDIETGEEFTIPLMYPPTDVVTLQQPALSALLSVSPTPDPARAFSRPSELSLFTTDVVPVRASWAADDSSIAVYGSLLTLRIDERVVALRIGVE
jgi:hypothetical protein